jgi:hypothetical protein
VEQLEVQELVEVQGEAVQEHHGKEIQAHQRLLETHQQEQVFLVDQELAE